MGPGIGRVNVRLDGHLNRWLWLRRDAGVRLADGGGPAEMVVEIGVRVVVGRGDVRGHLRDETEGVLGVVEHHLVIESGKVLGRLGQPT